MNRAASARMDRHDARSPTIRRRELDSRSTSTPSSSSSPRRTRSASGATARSPSRRRSTTGPSSRRRTASSASASSVRSRTGSATAASTSGSATAASSATSAASRSPRARCAASAWATSSWRCPIAHIWFFKGLPSRIGHLLDMTVKDLERDPLLRVLRGASIPATPTSRSGEHRQRGGVVGSSRTSIPDWELQHGQMGAEAIRDAARAPRPRGARPASCAPRPRPRPRSSARRTLLKRLKIVEAFRQSRQPARVDDPRRASRCCRPTCGRWCRWRAAASPPAT